MANLHSWAWGALVLAMGASGCTTPRTDRKTGARGGKKTPVAKPAAPATAAPRTPTEAPKAAAMAPAPEKAETPTTTTKLSNGATLTLPQGTVEKTFTGAKNLPAGVGKTKMFRVAGDEKRLLLVSEMDRDGKACNVVLDEQLAKMKASQDETDPQKLAVRKVGSVEVLKAGGERLLFSQAKQKGIKSADGSDMPFVGMANAIFCRDETYVVLMYASNPEKPEPAGSQKKLLETVAASYKK
ncbi:MAG: hypothetical protein AAGA56_06640 [Myxococcota bacterium]